MTATASAVDPGLRRPGGDPARDATAYLSVWLVLLYVLPAELVIGPLGAIGSPAALVMLPLAGWWAFTRLSSTGELDRSPQTLHRLLLLHAWYMGVSYVVALLRPLSGTEANGALRSALLLIGVTGVALAVADGVPTRERLDALLRRLVMLGAFLSLVGIVQFATGEPWQPSVPGLVFNQDPLAVGGRAGLNRPAGTAMHPIEFSVVTAALLPLAIHVALYSPAGGRRQRAVLAAVVIGVGAPISISRSGILVLAAAFAVMMLGWSWRQRANALVGAVFVLPVVWMIAPRLVDVLGGLFTETEDDFSVQARIDRIPRIMATFRERPWFGRGNGTWSVEENFLIDGEVWVTLLETGIIGLALTFVLLAVAVRAGLGVKHLEGADPEMAHLGTALAAAIVGIGVSFGTFDALHYRILTGTLFLLIGAVAAVYRLALPAPPETPPETIETGSARSALR